MNIFGRPVLKADNLATFIADYLAIWKPQTPGTLRACRGLNRGCFTFYVIVYVYIKDATL
jgi:hypothetical protein